MQKQPDLPSKAWVSLFWARYRKLLEPIKEGFINLAQSVSEAKEGQITNEETKESLKNIIKN